MLPQQHDLAISLTGLEGIAHNGLTILYSLLQEIWETEEATNKCRHTHRMLKPRGMTI
jgi:hypothetical protein